MKKRQRRLAAARNRPLEPEHYRGESDHAENEARHSGADDFQRAMAGSAHLSVIVEPPAKSSRISR
jgi:hypothetical protein